MSANPSSHQIRNFIFRISFIFVAIIGLLGALFTNLEQATAATTLSIEIIAGPNLVVDSNVLAASTEQPIVATVIGKFCNDGIPGVDGNLENVFGYIGDGLNNTPANYPDHTPGTIGTTAYDGSYEFTHLGGAVDAKRLIGTLEPGQCSYQYWSFTYPKTATSGGSTIAAWGKSVKAADDLFLWFNIWGDADSQPTTIMTHTMTMRNEIAAMANKIEPNGNPGGRWFNTEFDKVDVGGTITTNGILYRLGNVNKGFDNDNNGVPDYNAWLQPFGNASYDPTCFKLIGTTGVLTVTRSAGNPDYIKTFDDELYFTDLPSDNTNVVGEVFYTFQLLKDGCYNIPVSPYQEVASGFDNEKFNADYGEGGSPPISADELLITVQKNGDATTTENATLTYNIPFENTGTESAGLTLSSGGIHSPLMISDTIPISLTYVGGSANSTFDIGNSSATTATIYFSTDSGQTWSTTDPGNTQSTATNKVIIQWWLEEPLDANDNGSATFQAQVSATHIADGGSPMIENCATTGLGDGVPFINTCATTMVLGNNIIGDYVFNDDDGDGIWDEDGSGGTTPTVGDEPGIDNVTIWLYWDKDGNDAFDITVDELISTTTTAISGTHAGMYAFRNLPNGDYLVVVDSTDTDIPDGYTNTTPSFYSVTLSDSNFYDADFGFGPALDIDKFLYSSSPVSQTQYITYTIRLKNNLPGDGTPDGACTYIVYPAANGINNEPAWNNPTNAVGVNGPDGTYAYLNPENNGDQVTGSTFSLSPQAGNITSVEAVYSIYVDGTFSDDVLNMTYWHSGGQETSANISIPTINSYGPSRENQGEIVWDVTALDTWSWADFTGTTLEIGFYAQKTGGSVGDATVYVDSMGYRITTDQACGGAADTIATLPLTDTYDADRLQFVSASPTHSTNTTGGTEPNDGTITWSNLGPLYAGGTTDVQVVFQALDPIASYTVTTNTATVTNAFFGNGLDVNDDTDSAQVAIDATGSITGYVYSDPNGSGWAYEQGTNDFPISGATVELHGCYISGTDELITNANTSNTCTASQNGGEWRVVDTTTTDANGLYEFDGLQPGYYYTTVTLPDWAAGATQTAEAGTSNTDQNGTGRDCGVCDSTWGDTSQDLNETNFNPIGTGNPLESANEHIGNINFGYSSVPARIYGTVFTDSNGDGDQDSGEADLSGLTVRMCTDASCSSVISTTLTTASGTYSFTNVISDTYYIEVLNPPAGTTQTADPDESGTCSASCDDVTTTGIWAIPGSDNGSYDFGYQPNGSYTLGKDVYVDWNGNGTRDAGEDGISGVTLYLYEDEDGNGVITAEDAVISTTVTDANGYYTFTNLIADDYIVVIDSTDPQYPSSYTQTQDPDEAGVCAICNDTGRGTIFASSIDDVDYGYQPVGFSSIGDYVWFDEDADNVQDADESGISGVVVYLYQDDNGDGVIDSNDALVYTTTTDASGIYTFTNLSADNYIVQVPSSNFNTGEVLDGYTLTSSGTPYNTSQVGYKVALGDDEDFNDADFGFAESALGDFIWQDNDGDGQYDAGEPGISGVEVALYEWNDDGDGIVESGEWGALLLTDTTDSDGYYGFTSLISRTYIISVETSSPALANTTLTYDPGAYATNGEPYPPFNPATLYTGMDSYHGISLRTGQKILTVDFGYQPEGVLGDMVWLDTDDDGVKDDDEIGIADVTMYLCNVSPCNQTTPAINVIMTTTTNTDGEYGFGNLSDDTTYTVGVGTDAPIFSLVTQTFDPEDSSCVANCDDEGTQYVDVDDASNGIYLDIDFGYRFDGPNQIGGTVWHDADSGGQTGGTGDINTTGPNTETIRYKDVPVYLWYCGADDTCGTGGDDIFVGSTTTDASGVYTFTRLADATYRVIVNPNAFSLTGTTPTTTTDYDGSAGDPAVSASGGGTYVRDFGFLSKVDMGDLPASYNNTILAENGARHEIPVSGAVYLGSTPPDVDGDGQESNTAVGDDTDASGGDFDDDDGVNRPIVWSNGPNGATIEVTVTCVGTCYLSGWIDWNENGDFLDANEKAFIDAPVISGTQTINFEVPAGFFTGTDTDPDEYINARFRLYRNTTSGLAQPTGLVINGEVEDYRWGFEPTAVTAKSLSARIGNQNLFFWIFSITGVILISVSVVILTKRKLK